ncbi:MAG TPA: Mur ligase family protein, partial [Actinomycetota bacterium]|nr:Mur ligase family protein [Actinomycetota bacterium]
MRTQRASRVADAVSGRLLGRDRWVSGAVIDSREATDGSLFFALPGSRTDGHRFVADARARGASAAVVSSPGCANGARIVVDDPGQALLRLARWERAGLSAAVVGITGSVGKTTTKDFTACLLAEAYRTVASPRSYNNQIGVPLTILSADDRTEVLVSELGAGTVGEIAELCGIVRPQIGVVTAVAPAHLETFGSMRRIARAKAELVEALPPDGVAILNADDGVVSSFARRTRA